MHVRFDVPCTNRVVGDGGREIVAPAASTTTVPLPNCVLEGTWWVALPGGPTMEKVQLSAGIVSVDSLPPQESARLDDGRFVTPPRESGLS
jgi:hypothetical protein